MKKINFLLVVEQVVKNLLLVVLPLGMLVYFTVVSIFVSTAMVLLVCIVDIIAFMIVGSLFSTFVVEKKRYFRIPIMCLYSIQTKDVSGSLFRTGINQRERFFIAISDDFGIKVIMENKIKLTHVYLSYSNSYETIYEHNTSSWDLMISYIIENKISYRKNKIDFLKSSKKEASSREERSINKRIANLNGQINKIKETNNSICLA